LASKEHAHKYDCSVCTHVGQFSAHPSCVSVLLVHAAQAPPAVVVLFIAATLIAQ